MANLKKSKGNPKKTNTKTTTKYHWTLTTMAKTKNILPGSGIYVK